MKVFDGLLSVKLLRYGGVGGVVTILYSGLTGLFVELLNAPAIFASIGAFLLVLPAAYWGHREVSFRDNARGDCQLRRFVITMSAAFLASSLSVLILVNGLGAHYGFALLVTMVMVPLVNFLILDQWVFRGTTNTRNAVALHADDVV
jgi:putative flippase GtrA